MPNSFRHLNTRVPMYISVGILKQVQDDGGRLFSMTEAAQNDEKAIPVVPVFPVL